METAVPQPDRKPRLKENLDPGRYRKVSTRIHNDARFRALAPPPPCARYLVFFLLTSPATGTVPGLYRARETALAEELGWSLPDFRRCFAEAAAQRFVEADWSSGIVWLPNAVRHDPPASANVVTGWGRVIRNEMPECPLLLKALLQIRQHIGGLFEKPDPFLEAFDKAFPKAFLKGLEEAFEEAREQAFREEFPEAFPEDPAKAIQDVFENPSPVLSNSIPEAIPEPGRRTPDAGRKIPEPRHQKPDAAVGLAEESKLPDGHRAADFLEAWNAVRVELGRPLTFSAPQELAAWCVGRRREGMAPEAIMRAVRRYHEDKDFAEAGWPLRVFLSENVFRDRTAAPPTEPKGPWR